MSLSKLVISAGSAGSAGAGTGFQIRTRQQQMKQITSYFHTRSIHSIFSCRLPFASASAATATATASLSPHVRPLPIHFYATRHFSSKSSSDDSNSQNDHEHPNDGSAEAQPAAPSNRMRNFLIVVAVAASVGVAVWHFSINDADADADESASNWDKLYAWGTGKKPLLAREAHDAYGRKYRTLVINFDKTIATSHWTRSGGWQVQKRPHVDRFLASAFKAGYEIVLFASTPSYETNEVVNALDAQGLIRHRLFSDHTNFHKWGLCKDLTRLQRDPTRVIVIDHDPAMYCKMQENVLQIKPFQENADGSTPNDHELLKFIPLLENIQRYNIFDVRPLIAAFNKDPNANLFESEEQKARDARAMLARHQNPSLLSSTAHVGGLPKNEADSQAANKGSKSSWYSSIVGWFAPAPKSNTRNERID